MRSIKLAATALAIAAGLSLTAVPANAATATLSGTATAATSSTAAKPRVTPANLANVSLTNGFASTMCLDAENDVWNNPNNNGDKVELFQCNGGPNQQWNLNENGTITNADSGKCLDAENDSNNNPGNDGDKVELWDCNGGPNQQWIRGYLPADGWYVYINKMTDPSGYNLVLDAENDPNNNPTVNGDKVELWHWNGNTNQQWR